MKKAIYPGSFDPVTYGHLEVIERASKIFDYLIIGVLKNYNKTPVFSSEQRKELLQRAVAHLDNVEVQCFSGLLVNFARMNDCQVVVRGLRAITDYEYELQMAQTNRIIDPDIETVFVTTDSKYSYLSSSIVREVASYHGDLSGFVPGFVADAVREKYEHAGYKEEHCEQDQEPSD